MHGMLGADFKTRFISFTHRKNTKKPKQRTRRSGCVRFIVADVAAAEMNRTVIAPTVAVIWPERVHTRGVESVPKRDFYCVISPVCVNFYTVQWCLMLSEYLSL